MLVFWLIVGMVTETNSTVARRPRNLIVLVGQRMTIDCNPGLGTLGVYWYFIEVGGSEEIKLTSKSQIFSVAKHFSLNGKLLGGNLSVNSTELKHGGQIICTTLTRRENRSKAETGRFVAEVIVLESDPDCHLKTPTVKEGDNIEMWCIVRYSGNWAPVIEWREINGNIITNGIVTEATNNSLISTLNVSADVSKHNSSYLCLIYFTAPQNQTSNDFAENIPDYNYTWGSPLVQVLYGPKKASLTPQKKFYSEGDEIFCSAEANPSPRFEWKIMENNVTFDSPVFVVQPEMTRADSCSIQCTAINDATALQAKSNIVKIRLANWPTIRVVTIVFALLYAVVVFVVLIVIQKKYIKVAAVENNNSSAYVNVQEQRKTGENSRIMNGANGDVEYVEMNASGFKSTVTPPVGPSLFGMSIYAIIDHIQKSPPPSP